MKLGLLFILILFSLGTKAQDLYGIIANTQNKIPVERNIVYLPQFYDNITGHNYSGGWFHDAVNRPDFYGGTFSYTNTTDSYVERPFYGYKAEWYSEKFNHHGIAAVSVDGGPETMVDQYSALDSTGLGPIRQLLYTTGNLTEGNHVLKIRCTGTKNASSTGYYTVHDFVAVYQTEPDPGEIPDSGSDDDATKVLDAANGSDLWPCTPSQPCQTLERFGQVLVPGDVAIIKGGTYRGTLTPVNSGTATEPIEIRGALGETVIVSGLNADNGSGWTVHSGNIYRKTIALPTVSIPTTSNADAAAAAMSNTTLLAQQIFKDGAMQIEARWPDGVAQYTDLLTLSRSATTSATGTRRHKTDFGGGGAFDPSSLTDAAIGAAGFSSGTLTGATMVVTGWFITESRTITNHVNNTLSFGSVWNTGNGHQVREYYYLTHKLALLNQAREWHYEGGTLYYWQPGGGAPTGVEYKARNWGIDLRGRTYITIKNITFKGCDPAAGNSSTNNCTIDNIRASFMNHTAKHDRTYWQGYGNSHLVGTRLGGTGNVVKNSEFKWSASQAVWIGANGRVENNLFEDIAYDGMWGCPVSLWGSDNINNVVVTHNTMKRLGRGGIDNGYAWIQATQQVRQTRKTLNNEYSYNDISEFSKINQDGGAFYSWGWQDLGGNRFHHNWIHDIAPVPRPVVNQWGAYSDGIMAGFYFDQGSGPDVGSTNTIDHNVFWNMGDGGPWGTQEISDVYTLPSYEVITKGSSRFYNNTFYGNKTAYTTYQNNVADVMRNNISRRGLNFNWGNGPSNVANAILQGTDPLFTGGSLSTPQVYFMPQAASPAVGAGVAIPGITDGAVGSPDIGAYERGGVAWTAGYTAVSSGAGGGTSGAGNITALQNVTDITVPYNTAFGTNGAGIGLPASISCTLTGGVSGTVPITWAVGSYVPYVSISAPGFRNDETYTIVGTPVTGSGITNTGSLTVSVDVTRQDPFTPLTSGIAGIWITSGLATNATNDFGTVDASNNITLWKSLSPGPLGRNLVPNGTAPKLSGGKAVMIGTGSFQSQNKTDFKFLSYNAVPNNLKWTIITGLSVTDNGALNGIIGDHGLNSANHGMSLNFNTTGSLLTSSIFITGNGVVSDATFTGTLLMPGGSPVDQLHYAQFDYSLGTASRSKWGRGVTPFTVTSTGTTAPSNTTSDDEMNFGDAGTFQGLDMTGTMTLWIILNGTETDAVRDTFMTNVSVSSSIGL